jgi:hypothetical protein
MASGAFKHVEDLQAALEEHAAFDEGTIIRNYGPCPRPQLVCARATRWQRVVHGYYRRPGPSGTPAACQEARGWEMAARHAGLMPTRSDGLLFLDTQGFRVDAEIMGDGSDGPL